MDDQWPEVRVGKADAEPEPFASADDDPDDELLAKTPEDVVMVLGFDPLELEEEADASS